MFESVRDSLSRLFYKSQKGRDSVVGGADEGELCGGCLAQETPMSAPYTAAAAANAIIDECESRGLSVGPMKLQKLLYFVHGYYLSLTDKPWINEFFEAWPYGPVVPSIYHEFKDLGGGNIPKGRRATSYEVLGEDITFVTPEPATYGDNIGAKVLDYVLSTYGDKSGGYLSNITHKIGSPWQTTSEKYPGMRNKDISNDEIKKYFDTLVSK